MCEGVRGSDRVEGEHRELRRELAGHGIPFHAGSNHLKYNICTEGLIQVICAIV